jgi:S-methylmethionine-dependent homocysteine/selenocysteine methylase
LACRCLRSSAAEKRNKRIFDIDLELRGVSTMPKYRNYLPQLNGGIFLTDGGIETTLIFHNGLELPYFAAFHLLKDKAGAEALRKYFRSHASIARAHGTGFILESPTWRASPDWGAKLGYSAADIAEVNRRSIGLMQELREEFETPGSPVVISGCVGPRGDGYDPGHAMSEAEAEAYHRQQIGVIWRNEGRTRHGDYDDQYARDYRSRSCGRRV